MTFKPEQKRSGVPVPNDQLFLEKEYRGKIIGFNDPEGNWYHFDHDESLLRVKKESGEGRDIFIRVNGNMIPFEEWKKNYGK